MSRLKRSAGLAAVAGLAVLGIARACAQPRYSQLLMVRAAGDFEGYLSFGIGLAARGGYRISSLAGPDRVVIDFTRPRAS
jgi:hypothetical protein